MLRRLAGFVAALAVSAALAAQAPQVDIASLGPQVGDKALDFSLVDQNGTTQTLKSVAGSKGTILVFFRSADW
jgi:cytochrome oxidase Cu insertion factor (SCO1/SenC/PrrC family)